ncbi:uncharacterized protein LOC110176811 [Drosophila serrata]|uniref:uncharacterized protein LOC110176811 n=1 Tax=Drosophila serrata TaxID=7274 RepID=UPI000A1D0F17|nr:uncharacterized protein LOC110176811 [Drosophila serrata]
MGSKLMEVSRDQWPALRDLFAGDRKNLSGFDLIEYFVNYQPESSYESIKIYTTDKNWITHGNYMLIHTLLSKNFVYFDTVKGCLEDLKGLLCSLNLKGFHIICGYGERYKTLVEEYWQYLGRDLSELEHQGTIVYHLPSSEVQKWKASSSTSLNVGYLSAKHADLVDQHWAYRSPDSLPLIRGLLEHNVSAGVFDSQGEPLAWCLRSPHGSLSHLHVLADHRRQGLGSLAVRFMAKEIIATGSEVLATVVFANQSSRRMFEKLGFKPINKIYWAVIA